MSETPDMGGESVEGFSERDMEVLTFTNIENLDDGTESNRLLVEQLHRSRIHLIEYENDEGEPVVDAWYMFDFMNKYSWPKTFTLLDRTTLVDGKFENEQHFIVGLQEKADFWRHDVLNDEGRKRVEHIIRENHVGTTEEDRHTEFKEVAHTFVSKTFKAGINPDLGEPYL